MHMINVRRTQTKTLLLSNNKNETKTNEQILNAYKFQIAIHHHG